MRFLGSSVPVGLFAALCWVGVAGCQRSYRPGDEVMVEWGEEGKEYPALILTAEPTRFKLHFIGYDESDDEFLNKSRVKGFRKGDEPNPPPPAKVRAKAAKEAHNTYRVGDQIRADWNGKYYPAQIVEVVGKELYRVHYEGYGTEYDENVGLTRIQPR